MLENIKIFCIIMRQKIEEMRQELTNLKENLLYSDDLKNDLKLVCQIKRLIIEISTTEATFHVRKWTEI